MRTDDSARLLAAYHPDLLREPDVAPSDPIGDRRRLSLVWNVFRTFEEVAPSFWLRRFIARLCGLTDGTAFAPHTVRVACWHTWPLAPAAMLRRGKRSAVAVDVGIETEDLVLALVAPRLSELATVLADTAETGLLELAESTSWRAGVRHAYAGVLLPVEADVSTWLPRVQRRELMVLRAFRHRHPAVTNLRGLGVLTWPEIEAVLREAASDLAVPARERELAARTQQWVMRTLAGQMVT